MDEPICARHRILARFERGLCRFCFDEAVAVAEAKELEGVIANGRLPQNQDEAARLRVRLRWDS